MNSAVGKAKHSPTIRFNATYIHGNRMRFCQAATKSQDQKTIDDDVKSAIASADA